MRRLYNYPWLKEPIFVPNDVQNPNPRKADQLNSRRRRMIRDFVPAEKEEDASPREHHRPTTPKKP